jgi:hypothetical protein
MNGSTMASAAEAAPQPLPWLFFIAAILAAIAIGAILGYLGLTGHLGAGIPGSKPPGGGVTSIPFVGVAMSVLYRIPRRGAP